MKKVTELCFTVEQTDDNFVGIKYNKGDVKIIFPLGYRIPNTTKECKKSIKQLLRTIKLVNEKKIDFEDSGEYNNQAKGLPIDSYQWIIRDYLNNGIYVDNEKIFIQDNKNKINWKRTFKRRFLIDKKSLIYLELIVEKNNNIKNIISEIHAYCVDKSLQALFFLYDNISKISNIKHPNLEYYYRIINKELLNIFDDRKKMLFHHMKRIIEEAMDSTGKNDIKDYGIRHFEYAWEYMVNKVYGTENVRQYYPRSTYHLCNIGDFDASNLRPDTIMKDNDNIYILDSKYYKTSLALNNNNNKFSLKELLPSTDSIQKQITYGDFVYKNYKNNVEEKNK